MKNNTRGIEARNKKEVPQGKFDAARKNFLAALGVDDESAFEVVVAPTGAVVKQVKYTQQENGTMSGDFWLDEIVRGTE